MALKHNRFLNVLAQLRKSNNITMASSSNSSNSENERKKYPVRQRIQTVKAIESIVNWVEKDDDEILSDSDIESSEGDSEELESDTSEVGDIDDTTTASSATNNHSQLQTPLLSDKDRDEFDGNLSGNSSKKRKRGRPSLATLSNTTAVSSSSPSSNRKNITTPIDTWNEINSNPDSRKHEFRFIPSKQPGVNADLNGDSTPLDCFFTLFDEEVQENLISYINNFAEHTLRTKLPASRASRFQEWYPVTRYELLKFIAVLIQMGIDKRPTIPEYWSMKDTLYSPWYSEQFPRNRFQIIYSSMLHAAYVDDEREKKDKIEPFLNLLLHKFQAAFYPDKNLSLDEMVVKWKGRSRYRMYNPSKPEKYHLKTFGLCDSITGYTYNLLIYFGSDTSYTGEIDKGQSEKIFHFLMEPLGTGHHIFADRYYTTHNLVEYLISKKTYYTGTLMANRKGFPQEMASFKNLKHKESKFYRSEKGILLCAWKDKKARKPVIAVSTYAVKSESEVTNKSGKVTTKPDIIHDYNFSMNGCDRSDQMLSYYNNFNRRTVKWWKRLFIWCLEVTQVNAFILHCLTRYEGSKSLSLKEFKDELIHQLIETASLCVPKDHKHHVVSQPTSRMVKALGPSHLIRWLPVARNCRVCSTPTNRKRSHFVCITCNAYLHPKECFEQFHK